MLVKVSQEIFILFISILKGFSFIAFGIKEPKHWPSPRWLSAALQVPYVDCYFLLKNIFVYYN